MVWLSGTFSECPTQPEFIMCEFRFTYFHLNFETFACFVILAILWQEPCTVQSLVMPRLPRPVASRWALYARVQPRISEYNEGEQCTPILFSPTHHALSPAC